LRIKLKLTAIKCLQTLLLRSKASNWFFEAEDYHQDYVKHNPNQPMWKAFRFYRDTTSLKKHKGKLKPNH
jgi:peptide-methionine (S)-S-oxide reductase